MNQKRINELQDDFDRALTRLHEALEEDLSKGSIVVDGTIQRFEFTFELGWKLAKAVLFYRGIESNSPRETIKEAYQVKLIGDGDGWINMLEDRNKTAYVYDEQKAMEIYQKIKSNYYSLLETLGDNAKK